MLTELGAHDVKLVGIAKGPDRDAGREWFHTDGRPPFQLPPRDPVLYFLQRLRDEAHRFAITTHRAGRSKALVTSELDEIAGHRAGRKRALLNHFGSARGVKQAGLHDLEAAPGISPARSPGWCMRISIRGCGWRKKGRKARAPPWTRQGPRGPWNPILKEWVPRGHCPLAGPGQSPGLTYLLRRIRQHRPGYLIGRQRLQRQQAGRPRVQRRAVGAQHT